MSNAILGSSNADYHANKTHLSSSPLKTILKSPEQFYLEYILGQKENIEKDAFTEGSLVHALILEPEKIQTDYAIFSGLRKQGKLWEAFKAENSHKQCMSASQMLRAEKLVKSYEALPAALQLMRGTQPEHNMVSELLDIPVKARADAINIEQGYIVDIKTTSMPSDIEFFKNTVIEYSYQLSAALYRDIAQQVYGKEFEFYWLVLSKADQECHLYKASPTKLAEGMALYTRALLIYKQCLKTGIWSLDKQKTVQDTREYEIIEI